MTNCTLNLGRIFYSSNPILKLTYDELNHLLLNVTIISGRIQEPLTILKVNGKWRIYPSDSYRVQEAIKNPYVKKTKFVQPHIIATNIKFIPMEIKI